MDWNSLGLFHGIKGSGFFIFLLFFQNCTEGKAPKGMNLIPLLCRELGTRAGKARRERNEGILFPWNSETELWQSPKDV